MRRIGNVWLVSTATLREMCHIAEQHGAEEALLFIAIASKVREPSPKGGDRPEGESNDRRNLGSR